MAVLLPDGLVLRAASPQDLPAIGRLLVSRGDTADAQDLGLVADSCGSDGTAVVLDGDRVVSTLTMLDEVVRIDGLSLPAGQVELAATDPAYEGRGLIRQLMAWAHERSRQRGHLLQVMVGIPFFYRQFGYEYALPMARWRVLASAPPPSPPAQTGLQVRRATVEDIPDMQHLQEQAQAGVDVAMNHSTACWEWLVERDGSEQWVAEREGVVVGVARTLPAAEGAALAELAAGEDESALALVAHAADRVVGPLSVQDRSTLPAAVRRLLASPAAKPDWYYARVERLAPLLVHLAPVLQDRLAAAGLGDREHEVLLSSWRSHVRFTVGASGIGLLAEGGAEQAPISKGGSAVPPDALASLLLGPHGALGLEERLPDCHLGRQRALMVALFPPRTADLLTFYLPSPPALAEPGMTTAGS